MNGLNDLITQAEAARVRGVSRASINELVKKGRFKVVLIGGQSFLSRNQVEKYVPESGGRPALKKRRRKLMK